MTRETRSISPRPLLALLFSTLAVALVASAQPADAQTDGAVLADLPMLELADAGGIRFDLAAAGDPPLVVLLDTGIRNAIAGKRGIAKFGGERVPGKSEIYSRPTVLGRTLTVAAWTPTEAAAESPFVRLGGEFLLDYVLELDFVARRVRFLDPAEVELPRTAADGDEAVFELMMVMSLPFVEISVNGRPMRVSVDTSALVPFWMRTRELTKSAVSPKSLPVLRPRGKSRSTVRLFETDIVQLGSTDVGVFPVLVSQTEHADAFGSNGYVLGLDLLSRFHVRLDSGRGRLWLRRNGTGAVPFAGLPYGLTRESGAYLTPFEDRFEVFGVRPGTPAEVMGLLPGDQIERAKTELRTHREVLEHIRQQAPLLVTRPSEPGAPATEVLLPDASSGS